MRGCVRPGSDGAGEGLCSCFTVWGLPRVSGHGDKPFHVLDRCLGVSNKQCSCVKGQDVADRADAVLFPLPGGRRTMAVGAWCVP